MEDSNYCPPSCFISGLRDVLDLQDSLAVEPNNNLPLSKHPPQPHGNNTATNGPNAAQGTQQGVPMVGSSDGQNRGSATAQENAGLAGNQRPRFTVYAFMMCFLVLNPLLLVKSYWWPSAGVAAATEDPYQPARAPPGRTLMSFPDALPDLDLGPATVRMVRVNPSLPAPLPLPLHVPPGHIVLQIVDEHGVLRHLILSPQQPPQYPHLPPFPPGMPPPQHQPNYNCKARRLHQRMSSQTGSGSLIHLCQLTTTCAMVATAQ